MAPKTPDSQKQESVIPNVPQTMDGLFALVVFAHEEGMELKTLKPKWADTKAWLDAQRTGKKIIKAQNGRLERIKALLTEITAKPAQTNEAEPKAPEIVNIITATGEHFRNTINAGHGPRTVREVCSSTWDALEAVRPNVEAVRDPAAQSAFSSLLKAVELQDEITEEAIAAPSRPQRYKKPNKTTTADGHTGKIPSKPVLDVEEIIEESGIEDPQRLIRFREIVNEMCIGATS